MKRPGFVLVAILTLFVACWTSRLVADEPSGDAADMKHDDGTAEGRLVIGDAGEAVHFTLPKEGEKIAGVRIHGSRYGAAEAPKEKFVIYILNSDSHRDSSHRSWPRIRCSSTGAGEMGRCKLRTSGRSAQGFLGAV